MMKEKVAASADAAGAPRAVSAAPSAPAAERAHRAAGPGFLRGWVELLTPAVEGLARYAILFLLGLLCSRGLLFGRFAPFGVAAVAAVPYSGMWAAVIGASLGYLLPSQATIPVHYIAACLAAAAIRWTLSDLIRLRQHPVFAPLTALLPTLCTGLALVMVNQSNASTTAMYLAESVLCGGAAYFMSRTASLLRSKRRVPSLSGQELACAMVSLGIVLLALSGFEVGGISVGRILAVLGILFAARYGGVAGGSVAGVAAGVVFSLSTTGLSYLSGAYALGGLMAGVFSPVGRLASAAAFLLANAVASLQVGNNAAIIIGMYEVAAATLAYILLPQEAGSHLIGLFSRSDDHSRADGLRRSVIMKLDYAAKALSGVSSSVEEVSRKLDTMTVPDMNGVYRKAIDDTCKGCGLKTYCWERGYNDSMDAFNALGAPLRERGRVCRTDFSPHFLSHCGRVNDMAEAVNHHYGAYAARCSAESRVAQVRAMVADQFSTTSGMLEDMASELELFERFDFAAAQRVTEVLRSAGILPIDVSCRVDRFGRMSIEIEAAQFERLRLNKGELTKEISLACSRRFEPPCISVSDGKCRMQLSERPAYRIKSAFSQHVCGNGQLCGDSIACFGDGCGRQIAIISDGMGTGGRAAVDGAMASSIFARLVQAGIGFDTALRIVNSALAAKGGDESLATLDLMSLDLFSGCAEFCKAGAPITVVRRREHVHRVDAASLPVGILNNVQFAKANEVLAAGDTVVMLSDGALAAGEEWLLEYIELWDGIAPQELADGLVAEASKRRTDGHDDDITVLVLRMEDRVPKQVKQPVSAHKQNH